MDGLHLHESYITVCPAAILMMHMEGGTEYIACMYHRMHAVPDLGAALGDLPVFPHRNVWITLIDKVTLSEWRCPF